jgi:hypothetical protein
MRTPNAMANQVITSSKLQGLTREHEDHKFGADMHSTGRLVMSQVGGPPDRLLSWRIEYKCEVCNQLSLETHVEDWDLIREVLKDNGIVTKD